MTPRLLLVGLHWQQLLDKLRITSTDQGSIVKPMELLKCVTWECVCSAKGKIMWLKSLLKADLLADLLVRSAHSHKSFFS